MVKPVKPDYSGLNERVANDPADDYTVVIKEADDDETGRWRYTVKKKDVNTWSLESRQGYSYFRWLAERRAEKDLREILAKRYADDPVVNTYSGSEFLARKGYG